MDSRLTNSSYVKAEERDQFYLRQSLLNEFWQSWKSEFSKARDLNRPIRIFHVGDSTGLFLLKLGKECGKRKIPVQMSLALKDKSLLSTARKQASVISGFQVLEGSASEILKAIPNQQSMMTHSTSNSGNALAAVLPYDICLCTYVLDSMRPFERASFLKLLANGSRLGFSIFEEAQATSPKGMLRYLTRLTSGKSPESHKRLSPAEFHALFQSAGLGQIRQSKTVKGDWHFRFTSEDSRAD